MAHTPHTTLHELLADIRNEDTTELLSFIEHVNAANLDDYAIQKLLLTKTDIEINRLSDNQIELLKVMSFKNRSSLSFYPYGAPAPTITMRATNIRSRIRTYSIDYTTIPIVDTKFLSTYMKTRWKKAQPFSGSVKKVRGADVSIAMDMFSLSVFKQSIKKPFLRTEAKVLVQKVNNAFINKTPETTKIRNKFYAIILDNTPEHTKALYNELQYTILSDDGVYYQPEADEAICFDMYRLRYSKLISIPTTDVHDTFVSDTAIVTHLKSVNDDARFNARVLSAASAMINLYHLTANEVYYNLGSRMVAAIDQKVVSAAMSSVESIVTTHKILKELHEQPTQTIKD